MIRRFVLRDKGRSLSEERLFELIRRPILTEKSTLAVERGQYVFRVLRDANKIEIARAIEKLFDVKVAAVNTLPTPAKLKRFRGRLGKRPKGKKAIVTLREGSSIDMTAGVS